MARTFSVRVMNSQGKPRSGIRVVAVFEPLRGVATAYTDSDGWATLRFAMERAAPRSTWKGRARASTKSVMARRFRLSWITTGSDVFH
jgi:hypothetical protein